MVNDPHLQERVGIEGLTTPGQLLLDAIDRLEDVLKALQVTPQSGTASLRTRSRTRERSPWSVATSTLQPRSFSSSIISAA